MLLGLCPASFEYCCSAVWCSAADTHLALLDRVVSGASFLTEVVFECDLAHRRSVTILCMLYNMRCNPMHPLYGAPVSYLPVWVTSWARRTSLHQQLCASSLQNLTVSQDFYSPFSISVERCWWTRIRWCGTGGFQEQGRCLFIGLAAGSLLVSYSLPFLFSHSMGWYCRGGLFGLIGLLIALS